MGNYDVESDEDSDDGPPELANCDTMIYEEEVVQYCEWIVQETVSLWGPERDTKTCYEPKVEGSRYCTAHKCRGCFDERSYKSEFCMQCACPVV